MDEEKEARDTIEYSQDSDGNDGVERSHRDTKLKERLDECEKLQKEYLDGWQRAKADFINYKKEDAKRYQDMAQMMTEDMLRDIIVVLDSFEMARQYDMPQNVSHGIRMIQAQLEDVLRKRGMEPIQASPGSSFDPSRHESIGEVEGSGHPHGAIAEEMQRGYTLNGRVVRPARVTLAK